MKEAGSRWIWLDDRRVIRADALVGVFIRHVSGRQWWVNFNLGGDHSLDVGEFDTQAEARAFVEAKLALIEAAADDSQGSVFRGVGL